MRPLIILLMLCSSAWAQHSTTSGYGFNTANVAKHTVASLPTCNAGQSGVIRQVTDALTPTVGSTVAGGGAVTVLVHCTGTWIVG